MRSRKIENHKSSFYPYSADSFRTITQSLEANGIQKPTASTNTLQVPVISLAPHSSRDVQHIHLANQQDHAFNNPRKIQKNGNLRNVGRHLHRTMPESTLVEYGSPSQTETIHDILHLMADLYESVGVGVTRQYESVDISATDAYKNHSIEDALISAHAWSPLFLSSLARNEEQAAYLKYVGDVNSAWYTKHIFEQTLSREGLLTPRTFYYTPGNDTTNLCKNVRKHIRSERVVVNTCASAGGVGIQIIKKSELEQILKSYSDPSEIIQIQEFLEDKVSSPCYLLNIVDAGVKFVGVSEQKLHSGIAYEGSLWSKNLEDELSEAFPSALPLVLQAAEIMRASGARGPVNIDVINTQRGLSFLREANVRDAGSQSIARLQSGNVDGAPIQTIYLYGGIKIPLQSVPSLLDFNKRYSGLRVVLTKYNLKDETGAIAFCLDYNLPSKEIQTITRSLEEMLIGYLLAPTI